MAYRYALLVALLVVTFCDLNAQNIINPYSVAAAAAAEVTIDDTTFFVETNSQAADTVAITFGASTDLILISFASKTASSETILDSIELIHNGVVQGDGIEAIKVSASTSFYDMVTWWYIPSANFGDAADTDSLILYWHGSSPYDNAMGVFALSNANQAFPYDTAGTFSVSSNDTLGVSLNGITNGLIFDATTVASGAAVTHTPGADQVEYMDAFAGSHGTAVSVKSAASSGAYDMTQKLSAAASRFGLASVSVASVTDAANSLKDSLVAYWALNEDATEMRRDTSGNALHLDSVVTARDSTGKIDSAAYFDDTASLQVISTYAVGSQLGMGNEDFTVAGWVYMHSTDNYQGFVSRDDGTERNWAIGHDDNWAGGDGALFFNAGGGGDNNSVYDTSVAVPAVDTWYYIVGWYDTSDSTLNISVNNGTIYSAVAATVPVNGDCPVFVGQFFSTPLMHDGYTDEVAVWRRILTAAERTAIYNSGSGKPYGEWQGTP